MTRVLLAAVLLAVSGAASAHDARANAARGSVVFHTYCALCHGDKADGHGRAASIHAPPPANLTVSTATDTYKEMIIRRGGAAVGRSPYMPPWGQELDDRQIRDLLAYLSVIRVDHTSARE